MQTITLKIKNKAKSREFMKMIQDLDYVEVLDDVFFPNDKKDLNHGDDFFALAGIWKDRDITTEKLRAKAWPKRK